MTVPIVVDDRSASEPYRTVSCTNDSMVNALAQTLLPAHAPCQHFFDVCSEMRWKPEQGHVPRGVCGATGTLAEVELVLVSAEPGDPLPGETHTGSTVDSAVAYSIACLRTPATTFHQNIRLIMDLCFPGQTFEEQLRRIWRTNSVLCSARVECGGVSRIVERTCIMTYLSRQLALVPGALVAALGRKALRRLDRHGIAAFPALHPSSRVSNTEKLASWNALATALRNHRLRTGDERV